MTPLEYFMNAARCEEIARRALNDAGRDQLLSTAQTWRKFGEQAKEAEAKAARDAVKGDNGGGSHLLPPIS